jgi:hypothetical protein
MGNWEGRNQRMLESDNKGNSKKRYCWENMECSEERGESRGDPRWGLFTFHLSWTATSGKKLPARISRQMSSLQACGKPPKSETNKGTNRRTATPTRLRDLFGRCLNSVQLLSLSPLLKCLYFDYWMITVTVTLHGPEMPDPTRQKPCCSDNVRNTSLMIITLIEIRRMPVRLGSPKVR